MNFSKNLISKYKIYHYLNNTLTIRRHLHKLSSTKSYLAIDRLIKWDLPVDLKGLSSYKSSNITETEEVTALYPFVDSQPLSRAETVRCILFPNNTEPKLVEIARCASVEEVLNFVRENKNELEFKQLTQLVLALYDLQNIFLYHYEEEDNNELKEKFLKKLLEHEEFYLLLDTIKDKLNTFDPLFLSYTMLYLNRLGVHEESQLIQNMALELRDHLLKEFSLNIVTRLIRVIFMENSVRPFNIIIDLIPKIFNQIELIQTTKELEELTICLYKLNNIVTEDMLHRYACKIDELIRDGILTGHDYSVLLKVMSIFNSVKWNGTYSYYVSKYILLMKNQIELLSFSEMHHLYDLFFKNQEPGDALNSIQWAATKLLNEMDEREANQKNRLKLFSSVIYFSSPINKEQFRHEVEKYVNDKHSLTTLIILRKIYSYLKIFDVKLCDAYWNKALRILKKEKDFDDIKRLMENYLYFCGDLRGFKHYAFEHHVLTLIQKNFYSQCLTMIPNKFFTAFAFVLVCGNNPHFLNELLGTFKDMGTQLSTTDIFFLSHSLVLLRQRRSFVTQSQVEEINDILNQSTARLHNYNSNPILTGVLIKSSVMRKDFENDLVDDMLLSLKNVTSMSSKLIEQLCFNFYSTQTLIPEVINKCTEYIIHNKKNIVGFNAEKVLWVLYQLNYIPVNEDRFFESTIDIIIRDQERLSGLGFLQTALSLCFFNRMPMSFIKQIFNVEFLDKLDIELANCYFRDSYPHRVRNTLMQLNRAVCLEYPEYNVPWFHQKYIEEYQKTNAIDDVVNYFQRSVKGYLVSLLGKESIQENVITPYGYKINFVLHFDKENTPTSDHDDPLNTKVAVLLKQENSFTRFFVRLKGRHALKNRHLEILGFKVKMIKQNEWLNLLYAKEKIDFIKELVFS